MNAYFAVFNVHSNEFDLARRSFNKEFGKRSYRKYISPLITSGIMEIFEHTPTKHSVWFVNEISRRVNKRLGEPMEEIIPK